MKNIILGMSLLGFYMCNDTLMATENFLEQNDVQEKFINKKISYGRDLEAYGSGFGTALIIGKSISTNVITESLNLCSKLKNVENKNQDEIQKKFNWIESRIKKELYNLPNYEKKLTNFENFIENISTDKQISLFLLQSIYERIVS